MWSGRRNETWVQAVVLSLGVLFARYGCSAMPRTAWPSQPQYRIGSPPKINIEKLSYKPQPTRVLVVNSSPTSVSPGAVGRTRVNLNKMGDKEVCRQVLPWRVSYVGATMSFASWPLALWRRGWEQWSPLEAQVCSTLPRIASDTG